MHCCSCFRASRAWSLHPLHPPLLSMELTCPGSLHLGCSVRVADGPSSMGGGWGAQQSLGKAAGACGLLP